MSEAVRRGGGAFVSLKTKFYLLLAVIAIGVWIGMNNPQPVP